jgi:hypothetical protein
MLFKATLWTRELSLKKSTGIFTYPHQTVMDLIFVGGRLGWLIGIPLYGGADAAPDPNFRFTGGMGTTLLATAVMLVRGFFLTAVASYIVGLVAAGITTLDLDLSTSAITVVSMLVAVAVVIAFVIR